MIPDIHNFKISQLRRALHKLEQYSEDKKLYICFNRPFNTIAIEKSPKDCWYDVKNLRGDLATDPFFREFLEENRLNIIPDKPQPIAKGDFIPLKKYISDYYHSINDFAMSVGRPQSTVRLWVIAGTNYMVNLNGKLSMVKMVDYKNENK